MPFGPCLGSCDIDQLVYKAGRRSYPCHGGTTKHFTISENENARTRTRARAQEPPQAVPKRESKKDNKRPIIKTEDRAETVKQRVEEKMIKVEKVDEDLKPNIKMIKVEKVDEDLKPNIKTEDTKDVLKIKIKLENNANDEEMKKETNLKDFQLREIKTEKWDDEQSCQSKTPEPSSVYSPAALVTSPHPSASTFAATAVPSAPSSTDHVDPSLNGKGRWAEKISEATVKPRAAVPPTRIKEASDKVSSSGYTTASTSAPKPTGTTSKLPTVTVTHMNVQVPNPLRPTVRVHPQLGQQTKPASPATSTSAAGSGSLQHVVLVRSNQTANTSTATSNSTAACFGNQQRPVSVQQRNGCIQIQIVTTGANQSAPRGTSGTIGPIRLSSPAQARPYPVPTSHPVHPSATPVVLPSLSLKKLEEENSALKWHLSYYQEMMQDKGKLIAYLRSQGIQAE